MVFDMKPPIPVMGEHEIVWKKNRKVDPRTKPSGNGVLDDVGGGGG